LQGQPTEGKTHTIYKIVKEMEGFLVVSPSRSNNFPEDKAFKSLRRKKVVILLDDLTNYVGSEFDLLGFYQKIKEKSLI